MKAITIYKRILPPHEVQNSVQPLRVGQDPGCLFFKEGHGGSLEYSEAQRKSYDIVFVLFSFWFYNSKGLVQLKDTRVLFCCCVTKGIGIGDNVDCTCHGENKVGPQCVHVSCARINSI